MSRRLFATILLIASTSATGSPLAGVGRSIDGDSFKLGTTEVRLHGIDAPEFSQICRRNGQPWSCGSEAAHQLSKLVDGKQLLCRVKGIDVHGRTLAKCWAGETDINRAMVATGYALAYRRYSTEYVTAEESAKLARRGIWAGTFELPSQVRQTQDDYVLNQPREQPRRQQVPVVSSVRMKAQLGGSCQIKGNHSRRGELIYHLPGMPYYSETRAEQMFCTESDARAAGYRRSRADRR